MGKVRIIEQGFLAEERKQAIDNDTKEAIRRSYDLEDEIKLLRRAITAIADTLKVKLPEEFIIYNALVEETVAKGKAKKAAITSKSIKIRKKEDKR